MRRPTTIAAFLAAAVLLSGCSNATEETMQNDPETSLAAMGDLVEQTQTVIGGEWEVRDSEVPDACPGTGAEDWQFLLARIGPVLQDADATEAALRELWESAGLEVERLERPTGVEFLGVGEDRASIVVSSNPRATGIRGSTACFPDSAWDPDRQYVTLPPVSPAP